MVAALFVGDVGKFLFNFLTARHFCILLLNGDFRLPSSVFSLRIWLLRFFFFGHNLFCASDFRFRIDSTCSINFNLLSLSFFLSVPIIFYFNTFSFGLFTFSQRRSFDCLFIYLQRTRLTFRQKNIGVGISFLFFLHSPSPFPSLLYSSLFLFSLLILILCAAVKDPV